MARGSRTKKKKGNCLFHSSHCVFTAVYSIHSSLYLIEKKFATIEIFVGLPGPTSGRSAGGVNDTETKKKKKSQMAEDLSHRSIWWGTVNGLSGEKHTRGTNDHQL